MIVYCIFISTLRCPFRHVQVDIQLELGQLQNFQNSILYHRMFNLHTVDLFEALSFIAVCTKALHLI
jgi:hypothetical protein